jgi:hypothetical protein
MELELTRVYATGGTNGTILYEGRPIVRSIELPWKDNKTGISCIPEGRYPLRKRYSIKFGWHLQVLKTPSRELILVHPANDALLELRGCIAPVSTITGEGRGTESRAALQLLTGLVFPVLAKNEAVYLTIKSNKS